MSTQIPAPRVSMVDPATGLASRPWFLFLDAIYNATAIGTSFLSHINNVTGTSYSPTNNDWHLYCTGNVSITMPLATDRAKELIVTNVGTGVVTILPTGVELIMGEPNLEIDFQWTTLQIRPIVGGYIVQ